MLQMQRSNQPLRQHIRCLPSSLHVSNRYRSVLDFVSDEVVSDVYVLRAAMVMGIVGEGDGALIVAVDRNGVAG